MSTSDYDMRIKIHGETTVGKSFLARHLVEFLGALSLRGVKPYRMTVVDDGGVIVLQQPMDDTHTKVLITVSEEDTNEEAKVYGRKGGLIRAAQQRAKTHCPQGHAYTPENTVYNNRGFRQCRACKNIGRVQAS